MANLTPDQQLAAIQSTTFFSALQHQFQAIIAAMQTNSFAINGVISTVVSGVPVKGSLSADGKNISIQVGVDATGNPFYAWNAPAAWVAPPVV